MQEKILYDKPFCEISYLPALKCVHLQWKGFANSANFREACDKSLEIMENEKADKMLADNAMASVVALADQQWMQTEWFPKAYKAGFRYSAVVVATNIFRDLSVKNIVNQLDKDKFTVHYFENEEGAKDWLKTL